MAILGGFGRYWKDLKCTEMGYFGYHPETSGTGPDRSHSMYGTIPQIVPIWPFGPTGTICGLPRKQDSGSDPQKGSKTGSDLGPKGQIQGSEDPGFWDTPYFGYFRGPDLPNIWPQRNNVRRPIFHLL